MTDTKHAKGAGMVWEATAGGGHLEVLEGRERLAQILLPTRRDDPTVRLVIEGFPLIAKRAAAQDANSLADVLVPGSAPLGRDGESIFIQ